MRTIMLVLPILLLLTSSLYSATIHIPSEYSTIQEGLDAAQPGDTVLVAPGTYFENLNWPATNGIRLIGEMGPDLTVIDGDNLGHVILIETSVDTTTIITGLTIRNGSGSWGAGIKCHGASPRIIGNIITNNDAGAHAGGGVAFSQSTCVLVQDNQFLYNSCGASMVGIDGGGGLFVYFNDPPEHVVISGNTFIGNTSFDGDWAHGGGMCLYGTGGAPVQISSNEFIGNSADTGGGLCLALPNCYVTECNFEGNTSPSSGGGIVIYYSMMMLSMCTITGNSGDPGGIYVILYGGLTMDSCTVANNIGDGIRSIKDSCFVNYCNIFGNSGYGVYADECVIDATYCWWGDASGPGGVGPGTGDEVSSNVLYDPWLTEMGIESTFPSTPQRLSVFPNPFSSNAVASFELPSSGSVTIRVFDLSGRMVEQIFDTMLEAGNQTIELDGSEWSPGLYLIRLNTGDYTVSQRCMLVR